MDGETGKMFELILEKLDKMDSRLDVMDSRLDSLEAKFDNFEVRLDNLEARQDEIFHVVKAIEHANQVHRAEINHLQIRTDYLEGTINGIGNVITTRTAGK